MYSCVKMYCSVKTRISWSLPLFVDTFVIKNKRLLKCKNVLKKIFDDSFFCTQY